jgi:outer membrane protein assembly factor BamB
MRIAAAAFVLLAFAASAFADNWPQFRGPHGNGQSDATGLPVKFGEGENVKWKTPIPGKGWSSPVVWGERIWVTTATEDGKKMSVLCVDLKTGKILRDQLVFENENPRFCHPTNSYASPTPTIEEGRIYVHFGSYGTACLDTETGEVLWTRRDLHSDDFRGPASSPILHGDLLIVHFDGVDVQFLVALDKHTGKTVWKNDRDIDYGTDNGDAMKAYSTPAVIEVEGRKQLISPAAVATLAYDPQTGRELWRVRHGGMNAAALPLFGGGLVYISAGSGGYDLVAVRPDGRGDVTDSHIAWRTGKSVPKRSSQLLLGDLYFMVNDTGIASCLDATTGDILWQHRFAGNYWASPIYADGRIYFFGQDGTIPVVAPTREFQLLAENKLADGFNASPAVVGRSLILRTKTHLYCIEDLAEASR